MQLRAHAPGTQCSQTLPIWSRQTNKYVTFRVSGATKPLHTLRLATLEPPDHYIRNVCRLQSHQTIKYVMFGDSGATKPLYT